MLKFKVFAFFRIFKAEEYHRSIDLKSQKTAALDILQNEAFIALS